MESHVWVVGECNHEGVCACGAWGKMLPHIVLSAMLQITVVSSCVAFGCTSRTIAGAHWQPSGKEHVHVHCSSSQSMSPTGRNGGSSAVGKGQCQRPLQSADITLSLQILFCLQAAHQGSIRWLWLCGGLGVTTPRCRCGYRRRGQAEASAGSFSWICKRDFCCGFMSPLKYLNNTDIFRVSWICFSSNRATSFHRRLCFNETALLSLKMLFGEMKIFILQEVETHK